MLLSPINFKINYTMKELYHAEVNSRSIIQLVLGE
jgi:hypothetical protein